jgi:ketopantoate reductase
MQIGQVAIIGMGEVGRRFASALSEAGAEVAPVSRTSGWENVLTGAMPVLVCVREEALAGVIGQLGGVAATRLVFVQNGWVGPLLPRGCGRALVWFTSKGEFFRVLRPTPLSGPWAGSLAEMITRGGIAAEAVDQAAARTFEAEKMGFNCVVGLPLAVHGCSLGEYLAGRREEAEALFSESVTVAAGALGVPVSDRWWPLFQRAVEPLAWMRATGAKALEYRNGAIARLAREQDMAAPVTERLLAAVAYVP